MNDIAIIALYDDDKKVLMQHRSDDAPTSPGYWGFFGGGIEDGETPLEAIKRETYEELRVVLKKPRLLFKEYVPSKEKTNYYFIEKIKDKSKIELKEGQGMKWIYCAEIEKMKAKTYVKKALNVVEEELLKT
jgi:8-oxo-dGTP pyrophosphatase MutT (NUDIX family)